MGRVFEQKALPFIMKSTEKDINMTARTLIVPITAVHAQPPALSPLDARLEAAVPFVRGGVVADVGTDHAYLPISLLRRGLCSFAVATDIHRGPAEVAAAHLGANGIGEERARVLLTDGLRGAEQFSPTDICIFGMGGEMIAHIIDEAPWVKDSAVRLILQPMTRMEHLRDYLDSHGFAIREECLVKTDRIYQILCAEFDGQTRTHTPLEQQLGARNMQRRDALCIELAQRLQTTLTQSRAGKLMGASPDTSREDALLAELDAFLLNQTEDTTL